MPNPENRVNPVDPVWQCFMVLAFKLNYHVNPVNPV
jgi:hypothetical protein